MHNKGNIRKRKENRTEKREDKMKEGKKGPRGEEDEK